MGLITNQRNLYAKKIYHLALVIFAILFAGYSLLISTIFLIHFFTWTPIVHVMHISTDSVKKLNEYEKLITNTFLIEKEPK